MPWLNGKYYTRRRRVGDRVITEYIGGGRLGDLAALLDQEARQEREARREADRQARALIMTEDKAARAIVDRARDLLGAVLIANGYTQESRKWRKLKCQKPQ